SRPTPLPYPTLFRPSRAIAAAEQEAATIAQQYIKTGWQLAVGASGTVQALQEILVAQGKDEVITLNRLEDIMQQALACGRMEQRSEEHTSELQSREK